MPNQARCKSCNALIMWLRNDRTGKMSPIDAAPNINGNCLVLDDDEHYHVLAKIDAIAQDPSRIYTNHFATCPEAAQWKSK